MDEWWSEKKKKKKKREGCENWVGKHFLNSWVHLTISGWPPSLFLRVVGIQFSGL